jgi:hypothetical protein
MAQNDSYFYLNTFPQWSNGTTLTNGTSITTNTTGKVPGWNGLFEPTPAVGAAKRPDDPLDWLHKAVQGYIDAGTLEN